MRTQRMLVAAVLLLTAGTCTSCNRWDEQADLEHLRSRVQPSGVKILIIGIDGAAWPFVVSARLVAAKAMPRP